MKSVVALAAVAAMSFAGAAYAGEATTATKGPVVMSDSEMDKVTAGFDVKTFGRGIVSRSNVNFHARNNGFNGHNFHAACVVGTTGC